MVRIARDAVPNNVVPLRPTAEPTAAPQSDRQRRSFGKIMRLRSGRFQASYVAHGERYLAPVTFLTKTDAAAWLDMRHAELLEHRWRPAPPEAPESLTFAEYAPLWLSERELKPRTRAEYSRMLGLSQPRRTKEGKTAPRTPGLVDYFGAAQLREIGSADVKAWYASIDPDKRTARAHAYALLRAIFTTAAADELIEANPCRLRGASSTRRQKAIRPASVSELTAIAEAMPEKYRAMVMLASWCALRFGELTELRRHDIDLAAGVIRVRRSVTWPDPHTPVIGPPKSEAGVRDVAIPPHVVPMVADHVQRFSAPGPDGLMFPNAKGTHLHHGSLYKVFGRARRLAGRPDLRWHDLRHTGATLAAQSGATLAELMSRLGHSTVGAALIYQHAAANRDAEIARKLSALAANGEG
jgi:integrase